MRQAIPIDFLITAAGLPRQLLRPEVNSFDVQPLLAVEAGVKLTPQKSIPESSSQGYCPDGSIKAFVFLLVADDKRLMSGGVHQQMVSGSLGGSESTTPWPRVGN